MVVIHAYAIKDTGIHHVILSALEEQPNPVQDMGHVIIQVPVTALLINKEQTIVRLVQLTG
jgi:hypothetical protein